MLSNQGNLNRRFYNADHIGDYIQMGEERIHFCEYGEGEALLLIHSYGQSLYTWNRIIEPLSEIYHVIAVDLLGAGYSTHPELEYTIDQHSELLFALMDGLSISKAHICGFSAGALIGFRMAEQKPERVGRIVAISPGGLTMTMPGFIRSLSSSMLGWLCAMLITEKKVGQMLTDCFFDLTQIDEHMIQEYTLPLESKEARKCLLGMVHNLDEEEVILNLREVKSETLILWGHDDKWHPIDMANTFTNAIRDSIFCSIRNCGHIIHEEKPSRTLEYIGSFLMKGIGNDNADM